MVVWGPGADEGQGDRKEKDGGARPGWHLNPPHVVDLMEGCRSLFRRTGDELGRGPRPPTSFTFQPRVTRHHHLGNRP